MDKKFASRVEVAFILGINRRTFSCYCTGKRRITNVDMRKKLFDLTGIETFKLDTSDVQDSALLTTWADLYIEKPSNRKNDHETIVDDSKDSLECKDVNVDDQKCDVAATPKKQGLEVLTTEKNSLGGIDRPFLDVATDLRNWFNNQHTWKTQREIAECIGASHSGIKKVFQGVKKPEGVVKQKLYEMTQLECLRDDTHEKNTYVEEKKVCKGEDNIPDDNTSICNSKIDIPVYEVDTSIDKKNGHTKKMKIPVHEVKTQIVEMKESATGVQKIVDDMQGLLEEAKEIVEKVQEPVEDVEKPVEDVEKPVVEIQEPVEEVEKPVVEIQEPVEEVKEHIEEVKEHIEEVEKPVVEIHEPVEEVKDSVEEIHEPVEEVKGSVEEIQGPVEKVEKPILEIQEPVEEVKKPLYEVQLRIRELIPEKLDKSYHVEGLRGLAGYIENLEQEVKLLRNNKRNGNKKGSGDEVDKLASAFYSLAKVLKGFKNCTPEQRKKVKNKINAQDFGYVTSFMKAMYDEQSFTDFMFFADYELKGDEK